MFKLSTTIAVVIGSLSIAASGAGPGRNTATGVGRPSPAMPPAQARLMARRASEIRAVRNLAARETGLAVPPTRLRTQVHSYRYVETRELPDGSVVTTVTGASRTPGARHWAVPSAQVRIAELEQQVADLQAQLDRLYRQMDRLRAELRAARNR